MHVRNTFWAGMWMAGMAAWAGSASAQQPPRCQVDEAGSATESARCADLEAVLDAARHADDPQRGPVTELLGVSKGVDGVTVRLSLEARELSEPSPYGGLQNIPLDARWAEASRIAVRQCTKRNMQAGHFNGHMSHDIYILCSERGVTWRDVTAAEIAATQWGFEAVDAVSWAQANRAAEQLCARANQGFAGGHFNGHQANGMYGLYCYGEGAQWFDATDAELAATGFGFATPRLDDVKWDQAMRAATNFCVGKGFDGGFMNGHQMPNRYGVVCQR